MALLERERELAICRSTLEEALSGHGCVLVVEGQAGIGKTALLRIVRDWAAASGMRVLSASGTAPELRPRLGVIGQLFAEIDPPVHPSTRGPTLDEVVCALARSGPVTIVVDDAHWADAPSLRAVMHLVRHIDTLPVIVVIGARPDDGDGALGRLLADPSVRWVRPNALSGRAVRHLVEQRLGPADDAFVDACAAETGGIPFYLTALIDELEALGVDPRIDRVDAVHAAAPRRIAHSLRFRSRASAGALRFVRALAVLGDGASVEAVARVAELDDALASATADALARDGVLSASAPLGFAQPVVRHAVLDAMGPIGRAGAHKRAARVLATLAGSAEAIGNLLLVARPEADPWVVAALRDAAEGALAAGSPAGAAAYLRRAMGEPPEPSARAELLLELGVPSSPPASGLPENGSSRRMPRRTTQPSEPWRPWQRPAR